MRQIKVLETELSSLGFKKSNILTVPSQANAQLYALLPFPPLMPALTPLELLFVCA